MNYCRVMACLSFPLIVTNPWEYISVAGLVYSQHVGSKYVNAISRLWKIPTSEAPTEGTCVTPKAGDMRGTIAKVTEFDID